MTRSEKETDLFAATFFLELLRLFRLGGETTGGGGADDHLIDDDFLTEHAEITGLLFWRIMFGFIMYQKATQ